MRRVMLAFGLVSLVACGGDSTGPGTNVVGVWELTTVNGAPLPFTLVEATGFKLEILGDQIVTEPNRTWAGATDYREFEDGTLTVFTLPKDGLWSQSGANVTMNYADGSTARATISGNVMTFTGGQVTAVYNRH